MIVALNGPDGSGKSQQVRMLPFCIPDAFHITAPLSSYNKLWPNLEGSGMFRWWFEVITPEELASMMVESLNARYIDREETRITVLDRGTRMFKSVCAAMWSIRKCVTLFDAIRNVNKLFSEGLVYNPDCEFDLLLSPTTEYFHSVRQYIDLATPSEERFTDEEKQYYKYYQSVLREAMIEYFGDISPECIIVVDGPIYVVQNRIRAALSTCFGFSYPMIGKNLSVLVGVSGLSESGKSSYAEYLRVKQGFYRLKLRYFAEVVERSGSPVTPERISIEILNFIERHYYINCFSIESIHGAQVPAFLKLLLGDKFQIVFIDTPENIRISRCATEFGISVENATRVVSKKDSQKSFAGINDTRKIADIIIDNSKEDVVNNV